MKGLPGIIIAVGLGLMGALANWYYISEQARDYQKVSFIAVKSGVSLKIGDKFKKEHLMKVDIPQNRLGNLDKIAIKWDDGLGSVLGFPTTRVYSGDELLFYNDFKTPGLKRLPELLADDELAFQIAVDSTAFVTSRVNPGDMISFVVPKSVPTRTRANTTTDNKGTDNANNSDQPEMIGPFRILMVGNRTGSKESFKAHGERATQENVISVSVKFTKGQLEAKALRLLEVKNIIGSQKMQVVIHPKTTTK